MGWALSVGGAWCCGHCGVPPGAIGWQLVLASPASIMRAAMVVLTLLHPKTQEPLKTWRFEHRERLRIGRSVENDVVLSTPIVSRFHAELRPIADSAAGGQGGEWQLINHSVNGTYVNGVAIAQTRLNRPTIIEFAQGGPVLRFELQGPLAAAGSPPGVPAPEAGTLDGAALERSPSAAGPAPSFPKVLPGRRWWLPQRCDHAGNPEGTLFCIHCGQPIQVQKSVRQYQVLRVLGRGGMGITYLVWNSSGVPRPKGMALGKLQVLKEMNADMAQIPKAQELFEREARALKSLKHPGIPKYYDFFVENDKKYLVMELIQGQDLERYVRQKGPVSLDVAIAWMLQTCEILAYLHSRPEPMIHRDVKPGNLLLRHHDQRIVLLDFGAVKAAGMPPGTRIGAEGYSAPEQIQGRPVTQSDLYAIGPSLIYLLTGMSALRFYRRTEAMQRLDLEKLAGLPRRMQLVIWRLTEPNPSDRYQTAQELSQALQGCLSR